MFGAKNYLKNMHYDKEEFLNFNYNNTIYESFINLFSSIK